MSVLKKTLAIAAAATMVAAPVVAAAAPASQPVKSAKRVAAPVDAKKSNELVGGFLLPLAGLITVALGIAVAADNGNGGSPASP